MAVPNGLLNASGTPLKPGDPGYVAPTGSSTPTDPYANTGMGVGQDLNAWGQNWAAQNAPNSNYGGAAPPAAQPAHTYGVQPSNPNQASEISSLQDNINKGGFSEAQARSIYGNEATDNALAKGVKFGGGQTQPANGLASSDTSSNSNFAQGRDAAYNQATSRLDPTWNNSQHDLENSLTQQGIMRNSDAWNRAADDFGRNKNDAYSSAWNNAWNNGLASQNQGFQQDFSNRSLAQQGNLAQQGLNLQGRQLDQQNNQFGQNFGLQKSGQEFQQGAWNKQFDYTKQKDLQNVATSSDNATKNGLFGLGAAALTNPNTLNLLKTIGSGLVDAAGKITSSGINWLHQHNIGNADGSTGANTSGIYSDGNGGFVDGDGNAINKDGSPVTNNPGGPGSSSGVYPDGGGGYIDMDGNPVDKNGNPLSTVQ